MNKTEALKLLVLIVVGVALVSGAFVAAALGVVFALYLDRWG
jgi:hypothetical protein